MTALEPAASDPTLAGRPSPDIDVSEISIDAPTSMPTRSEIRAVLESVDLKPSLARSSVHALGSVVATVVVGLAAMSTIPMTGWWLVLWLVYALVNGTFAIGVWVIAHECGHRAFSARTGLDDVVGFVLHSALLVPYFSWQRSHAVHHARTNHLTKGETHVPRRADHPDGRSALVARRRLGRRLHGGLTIVGRLLFGWPAYLLVGATGSRGRTNHFWPGKPFSAALFPGRWPARVRGSAVGVLVTLALLAWWGLAVGSVVPPLLVYAGPYLVCNGWLVTYTWLQHTDVDVPHYDDEHWTFVAGALSSVDRPYGPVFDLLHHRIGSTHVVHHLDSTIPHYRARAATEALASAFPDHYRFDPTPVWRALWRVAIGCVVVGPTSGAWWYTDGDRVR